MIDRERFEQLATLAVIGEASAAELAELDAAVRDEPALARELAELGATARVLRAAVAPPASVPAHVTNDLERVRREALSSRPATEAAAAGAGTVVPFAPAAADRPAKKRWSAADWLAIAASVLVVAGMAYLIFGPQKPDNTIAVLAPRGETGLAQPTLIWNAPAGQRYDVWILPAEGSHVNAPALFTAKGVRPPVAFSELQPGPALQGQSEVPRSLAPDRDYRLLVCLADAGRLAGTAFSFHTSPDATAKAPPADFATAQQLAATNRPADALTVLLALPPAEREKPEVKELETQLRARILSNPKP